MYPYIQIGNRRIGKDYVPLVIAEIGINANGNFDKAVYLIKAAKEVGCECIKMQCHIPDKEMAKEAKNIIPINANESIYDIMVEASFTEEEERELKRITEECDMIYLSTPFSKEAVDRLDNMGIVAFKIGSGEINNFPLIEYIASKGKPVIISSGMNSIQSLREATNILDNNKISHSILHCVSLYPPKYSDVKLQTIQYLENVYGYSRVIGYSDHTISNWCCYGAMTLGASIVEKHYAVSQTEVGPDKSISMNLCDLKEMIIFSKAIFQARFGIRDKELLEKEQVTAQFAYASIVSIKDIKQGEVFTQDNTWVKRPGVGILAKNYKYILGKKATRDIEKDKLLKWDDIDMEDFKF